MRYPHIVNVYESLGWQVGETDDGIAVMAGPVDQMSGTGFIRIDTKIGPMDDRKEKLLQCGKELADQMLVATWSVVSKPPEEKKEVEENTDSPLILPFAAPTEAV